LLAGPVTLSNGDVLDFGGGPTFQSRESTDYRVESAPRAITEAGESLA
jgi:hypothetical protein